MEALTEIPEEKEGSRVNSADSAAFKEANEEIGKDEKALPKQNSVKSSIPAEPKRQDQTRLNPGSGGKVSNSSSSVASKEKINQYPKTNKLYQRALPQNLSMPVKLGVVKRTKSKHNERNHPFKG
ncbi:Sodium-dependent phosphate transporter 2 [Dissostichus eleginoides]|uniref:Sodium-dependent phosphate transporter 2 n=1 Tax=Dissostichus eleginoides TaxID=100907 RepID=A0AAD9BLH7_DISEL|nr:Sodium-dependent phosphate transporter 2 [Dissostichus eleginoides]